MTAKNTVLAAMAVFAATAVRGATLTEQVMAQRAARTAAVKPGQWHSDLDKARAYAEANGLPLFAVWSNGDFCTHCKSFEGAILSDAFVSWMKSSGMVFYIGLVNDGRYNYDGGIGPSSDGQEGYKGTSYYWCRQAAPGSGTNSQYNWPYVRMYWPKGGSDVFKSGSVVCGEGKVEGFPCMIDDAMIALNPSRYPFVQFGDYNTYNPAGRHIIDYLSNKDTGVFKGFSATPAYAGGEFAVHDAKAYPGAGLQVETNAPIENLVVPLSRTNTAIKAHVATNNVTYQYPNGDTGSMQVVWAQNETAKDISIPISAAKLEGADKYITIVLRDAAGKKRGIIYADVVAPVANSPANPLAPGERTAATLQPGEWTMDISTATNAVKAWGDNAYTLVVVGGSLWCPDCENMDKNLFTRPEFKAWTTSNGKKVALVALDTPNMSADGTKNESNSPCLLTRTLAKGLGSKYQSGAAYISRKGMSTATADKVFNRFREFIATRFNKLEPSNPYRPGVPTIYVLRGDGSIAGRIDQFSAKSQTAWNANYLKRLDELLDLTTKDGEERNGSCKTTDVMVSARDRNGLSGELSFPDRVDCYKIDAPAGSIVSFAISGTASTTNTLSVLDSSGNELSSASDLLSSGVEVPSVTLPSDNCFVKVSYPVDKNGYSLGSYYALTKGSSTVSTYTLKSDSVITPSEAWTLWEIADGIAEATLSLIELREYKFSGLVWDDSAKGLENKEWLAYDPDRDVFTAIATGTATLNLQKNGDDPPVFGYQRWNPGEVAFTMDKWTVRERGDGVSDDFEYNISVQRIKGISGVAEAEIFFVPDESSAITDGTTFVWSGDGHRFTWGEGTNTAQTIGLTIKSNTYADGLQRLVFELRPVPGSSAPVSETLGKFTLTITDNDASMPGRIALTKHNGAAIPSGRAITAKGGSKLTLGAVRLDGADGPVAGDILVDGVASGESVEWIGRDSAEKTADVVLPAYVPGGSNVCRIEVAGRDGSVVDYANKRLTVKIVPATAAEFVQESYEATLYRNVAPDLAHIVDVPVKKSSLVDESGANVSVAKVSGSLAPGIEWGFSSELGDAGGIYVLGVPTKAGFYTATFQVSEDGVAGAAVQVSITVLDYADAANSHSSNYNKYIAATRTVSDVMVIDSANERLVGLLTVTIPRSGRLSARYRPFDGESVSLMSTCWLSCAGGNFSTALFDVDGTPGDYELDVTANVDGTVDLAFTKDSVALACLVPATAWSSTSPASKWSGYYTVSIPQKTPLTPGHNAFAAGDGYMTLRMTAKGAIDSGKMTYAGVLGNGKAYSGTCVLADAGDGKTAWLPIVNVSSSDRVSGVLAINDEDDYRKVFPAAGVGMYWKHIEAEASASYEEELEPFGCRYDMNADLVACCEDTFQTQDITFFVITGDMPCPANFSRGGADPWDVTALDLRVAKSGGVNTIKLVDAAAAKNAPGSLVFSFNRTTGIVQGTLRLSFADKSAVGAVFRGVVMPGWGSSDCTSCKDGSLEAIKRPFISGACWFNDTFNYVDAQDRNRTLVVKRGCPFSVGTEPGK